MSDISEQIEYLKKSPVYAMSLGAKELFHSNFWQWLINNYPAFADVFFPDKKLRNILVLREQGNRDLTIQYCDKKFVVENKLKSLPSEEQLIKYQKAIEKEFEGGVITGIVKPSFALPKWTYLSYKTIGERILEIEKQQKIDSFTSQLIKEYANSIINLCEIIIAFNSEVGDSLKPWDNKQIEDIRLSEICKKIKADEFARFLSPMKIELEALVSDYGYKTYIWTAFTHSNSIIDIRFENDNELNKISFGIQIQSNQFRRCADVKNKSIVDTFNDFKRIGWFKEIDKQEVNTIFGKPTSMTKSYSSFKPNFVYQYWNIEDDDYTFEKLKSYIIDDMREAVKLLNSINSH